MSSRARTSERMHLRAIAAAREAAAAWSSRDNLRGQQRRDVWQIDSAIVLRSHTTLELENCPIRLSDRCRDNFCAARTVD